jgi:hypothetical protein
MADERSSAGWPEDDSDVVADPPLGMGALVLLYGLPLSALLLLPSVAWLGLLPGAVAVRFRTPAPHRRRLVVLYVVAGLISVAPWIALILRGDIGELAG